MPLQHTLDQICSHCGLELGCYRLMLDGVLVLSTTDLCHGDRLTLERETNDDLARLAQKAPNPIDSLESLQKVVKDSLES